MIKNFLYLDEDKMYSLSSQLFEGLTEYVLNESWSEKEKAEEQKGPVGSGRILADILKRSDRYSEKKFLNDYSYTLFEKELLDRSRVAVISKDNENIIDLCDGRSFVKVTSKATFNDINSIRSTLENFNDVGKAITHLTSFKEMSEVKEQIEKAKQDVKDRNQKSKLDAQFKSLTNINRLAKEKGLRLDQKFLDDLVFILSFGFQDQLEVQMNLAESIVSANLNRSYLREEESLIIRKYSRQTEVEFTMFGIITQHQREPLKELEDEEVEEVKEEFDSIKESLMNLVSTLTNVEATFTGRLNHEVIVDPIALYTEI